MAFDAFATSILHDNRAVGTRGVRRCLEDSPPSHHVATGISVAQLFGVGAPVTTVELIERIVRLELQQAPLEVLAAEMLAPLLEALDARAGALLCYRRDEAALTLAAGRGLAAAAAEQLATLRWGGGGAWEMPLRALVDRTVYHVTADALRTVAAEPVGDDAASTIAAIPLHRWHQPVGVILAIADGALDPERVLAYQLAYDVLALALAAALWGGARPSQVDVGASAPMLACTAWSDVAARRLEAHALEGRHVDGAAIDAMLRDLRGAVDALRAERRLDETERLALAARLADAERDRSVHAERTAILERELERQAAVLGDAHGATPAAARRSRRHSQPRCRARRHAVSSSRTCWAPTRRSSPR